MYSILMLSTEGGAVIGRSDEKVVVLVFSAIPFQNIVL